MAELIVGAIVVAVVLLLLTFRWPGPILLLMALAAGLLAALGDPPWDDTFFLGLERFISAALLPAGLGLLLLADTRIGERVADPHRGFQWRMVAAAVLLALALISLRHLPDMLDFFGDNSLALRAFLSQFIQPAGLALLVLMAAARVSEKRVRRVLAPAGIVCGLPVLAGGFFLGVSGAQLVETAGFWVFLAQALVPVGIGLLLLVEAYALQQGAGYEGTSWGAASGYVLLCAVVLLGMYVAITIDARSAAEQLLCDYSRFGDNDCVPFARILIFIREAIFPATIALLVLAASRKFFVSRMPGIIIVILAVPLALWALGLSDENLSRILDRGDLEDAGQTAFLLMQNGLSPVASLQAAGLDALEDAAGKILLFLVSWFLAALGPTLGFGLLLIMRNHSPSAPGGQVLYDRRSGTMLQVGGGPGPRPVGPVSQAGQQQSQRRANMNVCAKCGNEVREGAKFCPNCGDDLTLQTTAPAEQQGGDTPDVCTECGNEFQEGAKFCQSCGADLTRQQAIASPDVCTNCGNNLPEGTRFCSNCGADHTQCPSGALNQQGIRTLLAALTRTQQWSLLVLFVGGLLGFIGLFVAWTSGGGNLGEYLKDGFGDSDLPWWTSVIALGAIAGVVVTALNIVSTIRNGAMPLPWQLRLGAVLMGLCPLAVHVGTMAWIGVESGDPEEIWDLIWDAEAPGLWIALTGGILANWATSLGATISSLKL